MSTVFRLLICLSLSCASAKECVDGQQDACQASAPKKGAAMLQVHMSQQPEPTGATDNEGGFLQEVEQMLTNSQKPPVSVKLDFGKTLQHADAIAFKAAVTGQCATVRNCASGKIEKDCSADSDYGCKITSAAAGVGSNGVLTLEFKGQVLASPIECPEGTCPKCTNYRTCAGPSAETKPSYVPAGDCVRWEYKSSGAVDWFETYIGLYDSNFALIGHVFERGKSSPWAYMQLPVPTATNAHLKIMLGSYDASGGKAVGADLEIQNPVSGTCLPDACLKMSPDQCCYTGANAPLTEDGLKILWDCCCEEQMEVYIKRVIADEKLEVCHVPVLKGLVPWFSCDRPLQSLQVLRNTLKSLVISPVCPGIGEIGKCQNPMPIGCFPNLPPSPLEHRRRTCAKNR